MNPSKPLSTQVRTIEDAKDAHKKELRRAPGKDVASKLALSDEKRREITVRSSRSFSGFRH